MANRFTLNLRPRWGEDEPTSGELINQGIGGAISSYLGIKQANNDWADKISQAGGTVDPQPTWRDRLNQIRHPFGGGQPPITADQVQQGMVDRQVRPAMQGAGGPLVEDTTRTGIRLPRGVTPITDQGASMGPNGQWTIGGRSPVGASPARGISGALRPLYDTNSHNYPNQTQETYTIHGPNGQVAHVPFITPREIAAAEAAQRAKRSEFEYETKYKTDEEIRKERETAPYKNSGLTFEQRQELAKEDDDRYLQNRLRIESATHGNTLEEIDRRGRYSRSAQGGEDGGIDSKETSRGNALVSAGQRLMADAQDRLTGDIIDKAAYDRGKRLMDQGTRMLGEQPPDKGYALAPKQQTPEAARAQALEIAQDARAKFPNASQQAINNYVRNVMRRAGWKVQ